MPTSGTELRPLGGTHQVHHQLNPAMPSSFNFEAIGATQPMGKINLSKNNLILLAKYIVTTDVKCYYTIFFPNEFLM